MASKPRARVLTDALYKALEDGDIKKAAQCYEQLEQAEPAEARWPHRLGETLDRLGRARVALDAYERAVRVYAEQGFMARAVAMAKVVLAKDPERTSVLGHLDPEQSHKLYRQTVPEPPASVAPISLDVKKTAPRLERAQDEGEDEIRFEDARPSLVIAVSDAELGRRSALEAEGKRPSAERLAQLPVFPLFAELPREAIAQLAEQAELVELAAGAKVVALGEPADALYAIVEGAVRVAVPGMPAEATIGLAEGDVFGESCLLDDASRRADVIVPERLLALRISKQVLDRLVERYPQVDLVLFQLLARRLVANLLQTSELFRPFRAGALRELARFFELRRAAPGTVLLEAGKRTDGLFVLLAGQIERRFAQGEPALLGPGTIFGQSALLARRPAAYRATVQSEALLLRLPGAKLGSFASEYPPAMAELAELGGEDERAIALV
ncbi:MAG: cyclic nucleotide-binding domain-containing protein [Deltaproteobacteria bacterium]|nr:cyclic nucleotide-binding domain-containing protein [Deltaproteobacteria bacterium]